MNMSISKILLYMAMLMSEGWNFEEAGFWAAYFLEPFSEDDAGDPNDLSQQIDVDVIGDDEADDHRRGLESWS